MTHYRIETFPLRRRDDQELFTGDFISKIIVPHPALNFPKNVTVTYQVYRGWLTRGLSLWSINKVILSDSFGESYSLCKTVKLESGKPQRMTLQSGNCYEEETRMKRAQEAAAKAETTSSAPQSSTEIYPTFNTTYDVIELGKHIPLERNETESVASTASTATTTEKSASIASWKPLVRSSSGEDANVTQPAASSSEIDEEKFLNIGERMPKKAKTEKRSFGESGEDGLANAVPIRDDSSDLDEPLDEDVFMDESMDDKLVTVQLFQYRLGDVFEKAEKYARNTLFPLLSEQFSSIFSFESTEPPITDNPIVIKTKANRKFDEVEEIDLRSLQTMGLKIQDVLKPIEKIYNSYELKTDKDEDTSSEKVRIDLPTYRPEISSEKVFIPIVRNP